MTARFRLILTVCTVCSASVVVWMSCARATTTPVHGMILVPLPFSEDRHSYSPVRQDIKRQLLSPDTIDRAFRDAGFVNSPALRGRSDARTWFEANLTADYLNDDLLRVSLRDTSDPEAFELVNAYLRVFHDDAIRRLQEPMREEMETCKRRCADHRAELDRLDAASTTRDPATDASCAWSKMHPALSPDATSNTHEFSQTVLPARRRFDDSGPNCLRKIREAGGCHRFA